MPKQPLSASLLSLRFPWVPPPHHTALSIRCCSVLFSSSPPNYFLVTYIDQKWIGLCLDCGSLTIIWLCTARGVLCMPRSGWKDRRVASVFASIVSSVCQRSRATRKAPACAGLDLARPSRNEQIYFACFHSSIRWNVSFYAGPIYLLHLLPRGSYQTSQCVSRILQLTGFFCNSYTHLMRRR